MNNILLEIDGSADALTALDMAISLTRAQPTVTITPHYVVDTQSVWKFLGMEKPGLVGSGPYFQAFDSVKAALYELMETITESYQVRCEHLANFADLVIDEGDFISKVKERATVLKAPVLIGKATLLRNAEANNKTLAEVADSIQLPLVVVDQTALLCGCDCCYFVSTNSVCTENFEPQILSDLLVALAQTETPMAA
jgi:hypothetical protein